MFNVTLKAFKCGGHVSFRLFEGEGGKAVQHLHLASTFSTWINEEQSCEIMVIDILSKVDLP